MKKEEIEQRLSENKQERKQLKQQLKDLPCLEVGRWYWDSGRETLISWNSGNYAYGFFHDKWGKWSAKNNKQRTPATDKEVEEALIKEAKKRGFKEGVEIAKTGINKDISFTFNPISGVFHTVENNILDSNGEGYVFKDGEWAEIIQTKTVHMQAGNYTEVQLKDILNSQF